MSATPTPGPWYIDPTSETESVWGARGRLVAECSAVHSSREINRANAALIAAAPDLLAKLAIARRYIADDLEILVDSAAVNGDGGAGDPHVERARELLAHIDAVIASATGTAP